VPLNRDDRLRRAEGVDPRSLPLTPTDGFVLSLIVGQPRLAEILVATGMEREAVMDSLQRLVDHGVVEVADGPAKPVESTRGISVAARTSAASATPKATVREVSVAVAPNFRDRAAQRRAEQMRAVLSAKSSVSAAKSSISKAEVESILRAKAEAAKSARSAETSREDAKPKSEQASRTSVEVRSESSPNHPAVEARDDLPQWRQVDASDRRIVAQSPVTLETQRRVFWIRDHEDRVSDLEILGLQPQADLVAARTAYHAASRWLHPDAYYGKELGELRAELEKAFATLRKAFERLSKAQNGGGENPRKSAQSLDAAKRAERAAEYYMQGQRELEQGHLQGAASLFKIALDIEPEREVYHRAWQGTWARAQQEKARKARMAAERSLDLGDLESAAQQFETVVRANPSAANLAAAAACIVRLTPARGRELALSAIDALHVELSTRAVSPGSRCEIHLACARTFLILGQVHTAREQLENARRISPDHEDLAGLQALVNAG
jgi:hypothetical protein